MKFSVFLLAPILCSGLTRHRDLALCQAQCQESYMKCIDECSGDTECSLECNRNYVACEESCKPEDHQ